MYKYCMTRTINLQSHLTLPELEQRYRQAADVVAKTQWQVVWLFAQGRSTEDIAYARLPGGIELQDTPPSGLGDYLVATTNKGSKGLGISVTKIQGHNPYFLMNYKPNYGKF